MIKLNIVITNEKDNTTLEGNPSIAEIMNLIRELEIVKHAALHMLIERTHEKTTTEPTGRKKK